jgi:hypothetical protein
MSVPKADMTAFCDITGLGNYSRKEAKGCNVIPATRGSIATIWRSWLAQSAIHWFGRRFLWHFFAHIAQQHKQNLRS